MTILLDENFPLRLLRRLRQEGKTAEHIIPLGKRGISDSEIRRRLQDEVLLFLTNDTEFLSFSRRAMSTVLVSRVPQRIPIDERVELWIKAINQFFSETWSQKIIEIGPDGTLYPWDISEL